MRPPERGREVVGRQKAAAVEQVVVDVVVVKVGKAGVIVEALAAVALSSVVDDGACPAGDNCDNGNERRKQTERV
eukprot:3652726-Pleurochrysis_carterae.AAC.4